MPPSLLPPSPLSPHSPSAVTFPPHISTSKAHVRASQSKRSSEQRPRQLQQSQCLHPRLWNLIHNQTEWSRSGPSGAGGARPRGSPFPANPRPEVQLRAQAFPGGRSHNAHGGRSQGDLGWAWPSRPPALLSQSVGCAVGMECALLSLFLGVLLCTEPILAPPRAHLHPRLPHTSELSTRGRNGPRGPASPGFPLPSFLRM